MTNLKISKRGFTLIELLMVVAIIAAIAAIALPMFGEYRVRAFNASAVTDLRNLKVLMESAFNDTESYPTF